MPVRRKTFSCGHRGLGQQCNRCRQVELAAQAAQREVERLIAEEAARVADWDRLLGKRSGESHRFPKVVRDAAVEIVRQLERGVHFNELRPHRMPNDRRAIRFDLPLYYRLVGYEADGGLLSDVVVMSHQEYSKLLPGDRAAR